MKQSKGRDNEKRWVDSANIPNYRPKVELEPYSYFADFMEYARTTLLPWTCGILLGALAVVWYLLG